MTNNTIVSRQESLQLDGNPSVVAHMYSLEEAKLASELRKDRDRSDELAIHKNRCRTFINKTEGLWVPASEGELKYVTHCPESLLDSNSKSAKRRVIDKYEGNPKVSKKQSQRWGNFASGGVRRISLEYFAKYKSDATNGIQNLKDALDKDLVLTGEYNSDRVRGSEQALCGLTKYLIDLRSFVGANVEEDFKKRKWLQSNFVHKMADAEEWALEYIDRLSGVGVENLYKEAYYSFWSRKVFWQNIVSRINERKELAKRAEPRKVLVPTEEYENDIDTEE